jgi:hypothetical protein
LCELGAAGLNNDAASKSTWAVVDYSHASKAARRPGGGPLAATTTRMVLLKNRCSALGSLLRHRAKLPLYVLKAAEGNTPFLSSSRYRTGMPRCCDPSRALASLKPNLVAMLTSPKYDLAITSPWKRLPTCSSLPDRSQRMPPHGSYFLSGILSSAEW